MVGGLPLGMALPLWEVALRMCDCYLVVEKQSHHRFISCSVLRYIWSFISMTRASLLGLYKSPSKLVFQGGIS